MITLNKSSSQTRLVLSYPALCGIVGSELLFAELEISFQHRAALLKTSTEPDPRAEPPFGSTTSHHGSIACKPTGASRGRGRRHPATSVSACGGSSSSDNVEKASSAIAQLRSSGINDGQHSAGHLFEHCHVRQRQGGGMKMQGTVDGVHIPL